MRDLARAGKAFDPEAHGKSLPLLAVPENANGIQAMQAKGREKLSVNAGYCPSPSVTVAGDALTLTTTGGAGGGGGGGGGATALTVTPVKLPPVAPRESATPTVISYQ
jgi:hypothetical protein